MGNHQRPRLVETASSPLLNLQGYDYRSPRGTHFVCEEELRQAMDVARENMPSRITIHVSNVEPVGEPYIICELRRTGFGSKFHWRDIGRGDWYDAGGVYTALSRLIRKVERGWDEEFYLWVGIWDEDE